MVLPYAARCSFGIHDSVRISYGVATDHVVASTLVDTHRFHRGDDTSCERTRTLETVRIVIIRFRRLSYDYHDTVTAVAFVLRTFTERSVKSSYVSGVFLPLRNPNPFGSEKKKYERRRHDALRHTRLLTRRPGKGRGKQ